MNSASFRFYEELNDFLPACRRKKEFIIKFNGNPSVKDAIEDIGIPHTEIDLILVNGNSVGFDHHLKDNDHVSVYPVFESLEITPIIKLREQPLRDPKFVLDTHLGKLARLLRMVGFDSIYRNDIDDKELIHISVDDHRIILTRDKGILKHSIVTHGYFVKSTDPSKQIVEIIKRFDLISQIKAFHRCMICNHEIFPVEKSNVLKKIPARTAKYYDKFFQCSGCKNIYWEGTHYNSMKEQISEIMDNI